MSSPALWFQGFPRHPAAAAELSENGRLTEKGTNYVFSEDLAAAVEVAMGLGRPLLVTGEPGCGKTELGYAIARRLAIAQLYYFSVKSNSEARDVLYTYDAIERFGEAQAQQLAAAGGARRLPDVGEYIQYQALGQAILDAHPRGAVTALLRSPWYQHPGGPRRSVVVIDEIDKATRDFPNDLLREIEDLSFRVPEYLRGSRDAPGAPGGATPSGAEISPEHRPIIVITSNEENQLPDAFLRRCVFFQVPFPEPPVLRQIIAGALAKSSGRIAPGFHLTLADNDRDALIDLLLAFRDQPIEKKPGISEMIDAAHLVAYPAGAPPPPLDARLKATRTALAKLKGDGVAFDQLRSGAP
jgi:MoxR-like ATPase